MYNQETPAAPPGEIRIAAVGSADRELPALSAYNKDPEVIMEPEFCRRLNISRRTAHDWRKKGKVPYIQLPGGRGIRYVWPGVLNALTANGRP